MARSGAGWGASPEGSRPFLDALDANTGASRRLWQSAEDRLEQTGSLLSDAPGAPLRCAAPSQGPLPASSAGLLGSAGAGRPCPVCKGAAPRMPGSLGNPLGTAAPVMRPAMLM